MGHSLIYQIPLLLLLFALALFLARKWQRDSRDIRIARAVSIFSAKLLDESPQNERTVRYQIVDYIDSLFAPRVLLIYGRETFRNENDLRRRLVEDRRFTRLIESRERHPTTFPEELQSFFSSRINDGDTSMANGAFLSDLAQSLLLPLELLSPYFDHGIELFLPFFDREGESYRLRSIYCVGMPAVQKRFKGIDLELLKSIRAPALLAVRNQELHKTSQRIRAHFEAEQEQLAQRFTRTLPHSSEGESAATFVYTPDGKMAEIIAHAERFATQGSPVLVTGETGTGKEYMARILHGVSGRTGGLVTINCSAIPQDLIENELFGHEKGAYTGASESSDGMVKRAEHGTLFLDEIGELPLAGQVKLLRLVQEGEYERIGSTRTLRTDARFIFATNRNLELEVREGRFRADLFFRISTFEIRIPPLRERREDMPMLIDHFLWIASRTLSRNRIELSEAARERLLEYSWPGNVRELENLILRCVVMSDQDRIDLEQLPPFLRETSDFERKRGELVKLEKEQRRLELELIMEAMEKFGGNQRLAAEALGISRGSLQYKLRNSEHYSGNGEKSWNAS